MAVLGPQTILDIALPDGVDGNIVAAWQMREGRTYEQFVNELSLALGDMNSQLATDWGWLFGETIEPSAEYEQGQTVTEAQIVTDLSKVNLTGANTIGHMLPLQLRSEGAGGSWKYFERTREAKVRALISSHVRKFKWSFEKALLTRWFTNTENAIGNGYDVPFVRGNGGNVDFVPPGWEGQSFANTHDHYIGVDSDTKQFDELIEELIAHLVEHGHDAPFKAMVSKADLASYKALNDFVQVVAPVVQTIDRGSNTTGSQFFASGEQPYGFFGYYQSNYGLVEMHYSARIPTKYAGAVKSYGNNVETNPLKVRTGEEGFGAYIVTETSDSRQWPVKAVYVVFEFGVGVGMDRTNGAAAFLDASGNWTNPTIS